VLAQLYVQVAFISHTPPPPDRGMKNRCFGKKRVKTKKEKCKKEKEEKWKKNEKRVKERKEGKKERTEKEEEKEGKITGRRWVK